MKRILLTLITIFYFQTLIYGQDYDQNRDFIYTINNQLTYGQKVKLKKPLLASSYIILDTTKYMFNKVKFYNNSDGFFANVSLLGGFSGGFAKRILSGKINLFKEYSYFPGMMMPSGGGGMMMMGGGSSLTHYYNRGWGDLKIADYDNLIIDLADNPESISLLNNYKTTKNISTVFNVVGGVIVLYAILMGAQGTEKYSSPEVVQAHKSKVLGTAAIGAGAIFVGWVIKLGADDNIVEAVKTYNE